MQTIPEVGGGLDPSSECSLESPGNSGSFTGDHLEAEIAGTEPHQSQLRARSKASRRKVQYQRGFLGHGCVEN